jgi:heat shock protein HslJ
MESSTSKIMINVLIVTAIALIGVSVVSVMIKKPEPATQVATTQETITEVATTTDNDPATTTETTSTDSSSTTSPLTEKTWTWVKTTKGTTTTSTPKKEKAFTVTFTQTGSLQGTTDCNKFLGTYTSSSNKISLSQLGSTKMYCEGSQENEFTATLQKITSYSIDNENNLVLTTASGTMVFR